jgi:hypothetical protein
MKMSPKKFYPHLFQRLFVTLWFGFVILIGILPIPSSFTTALQLLYESPIIKINFLLETTGMLLVQSLFILIGLLMFGEYNFTYIMLMDEGIEYKNLFYKITAKWEDIIFIYRPLLTNIRFSIDTDQGEYLQLSASKPHSYIKPILFLLNNFNISKNIPISMFAWNWRSSELGNIIFNKASNLRYRNLLQRIP